MPRQFLSRNEWPLIAVGGIAGVLTALLMLYLFVTNINGGVDPTLIGYRDPDAVERPPPGATLPEGPGPGLIGAREAGIWSRLEGARVVARQMRGPIAITARDLVWNEEDGARFARADFISGNLNARAAARGDVLLDNVIMRRPVITLRQPAARADWNFAAVFEELLADDGRPRGPVRTIQLRNVQILDGTVDVTRPEQRFVLRSVEGRMPLVVLSQPGVPEPYLRVAGLTMQFDQTLPVAAQLAIAAEDGLFQFPSGRVRFDVADVRLDQTQLASVVGVWDPADPGYAITATGLALDVRFEDVAFVLPPAFPATGQASFGWSIRPLPGDLTEATLTDLDARSGDSRVLGSMTVAFGEEFFALRAANLLVDPLQLALIEGFTGPLPYGGAVTGRVAGTDGDISFDLTADLTAPGIAPFDIGVTGRALLLDDGVLLQQAELVLDRVPLAALRAVAPALPVGGLVTGRIALTGLPTASPLALDVRLELGAGVALVEGSIDLRGAVPSYDLSGRLLGVDLQSVLAPEVPPAALTATFSLRGSGVDPEVMDASLRMAGRFTGWETGPTDTLDMVADIRRGVLDLHSLALRLATADVTASGTWRFLEPQSGAVTYAVDVSSLRPFGPFLPVLGDTVASGAVTAAGTLSGSIARLRLVGEMTAVNARVGDWQVALLAADYNVGIGGDRLPEAVVTGTARGLVTPTAGSYTDAVLSLRLTPPALAFEINAVRPDGGVIDVAATGTLPEEGPRTIVLERIQFDLDDAHWSLAQPATIRWIGDEWHIDGLALQDAQSDGLVMVDGRLLPMIGIDARIQIAALPTGDLQRLFGMEPRVEGVLWAEGIIRGATDDPLVDMEFRVDDGIIEGVALQRLEGRIAYRDLETLIDARAVVDTVGFVALEARLPSRLQFGDGPVFELIDGVQLSGTLTAEQFALATIAPVLPADVRDVTGTINAHVVLSGTAEAPVVAGSATMAGGGMFVADLNQRYTEATGTVEFDGRRLLITDLRARSDGWVVIGGQVVLERLDQPVLDMTVVFEGFRPMGVENQRDAALFGRLGLSGRPTALVLTGNLRVDDGYLVIPQFGGGGADLVDITRPAPVMGRTMEPIEGGGAIENLAIRNLIVTAGDAAWFMADEARVQLSGDLVINKSGTSMPITGVLEGTRGQYTLLAGPIVRRFDIVYAQVRFLGSPTPNPSVDITARRIVFDPGGRQVDVDVRITGTMDNPRIALAGGDAVGIAESELLSFLIFGQPTFALGGEFTPGDALLTQTFAGGFAELLAIELERGLGVLGFFDIFQVRFGRGRMGGLGAPALVLGRQLREDVFLTAEAGLNALFGGGGSSEAPNHWAIRLEWAFDPRSRAVIAIEPVYTGRAFRGAAFALPSTALQHQGLIEVRRRWTY